MTAATDALAAAALRYERALARVTELTHQLDAATAEAEDAFAARDAALAALAEDAATAARVAIERERLIERGVIPIPDQPRRRA